MQEKDIDIDIDEELKKFFDLARLNYRSAYQKG
mgnify:FL=1